MAKVSRETASHVEDIGVLESRSEEVDGTTIEFTSFREDADATPVDLRTAAAIEAAEARAWADLYAAAPADWSAAAGLGAQEVGGAFVVRWAATGRRYFSRTIGLGVFEPAHRAAIEEILDGFDRTGITMFLLQ